MSVPIIGRHTAGFSVQPFTRTTTRTIQPMPGETMEQFLARQAGTTGIPAAITPAKPALGEDVRAAFQRAMAQYQPGGGFGVGTEAALERGRTKALAAGGQALASAGLAGTTMMAGLGKKFEEEVSMPTRAGVEEERARRLSDLEVALAGAEQRGYESAEERASRERLAGGQLGLGYAQLGFQQEQAAMEDIRAGQQQKLALTALQRQTTQGGGYGGIADTSLSPSSLADRWTNLSFPSSQGYIGSTLERLENYRSSPEFSYYGANAPAGGRTYPSPYGTLGSW